MRARGVVFLPEEHGEVNVGDEDSEQHGADGPERGTEAVELRRVGIQGVGAQEDGEVSKKVADDEGHKQDAGGGDDRLLAYGGEEPKLPGAGSGGFGCG